MIVTQEVIQTLVPINALTDNHLLTLLRDVDSEIICAGQTIFDKKNTQHQHMYLLSGTALLSNEKGVDVEVSAQQMEARYSLCHISSIYESAVAITDSVIVCFDSEQLDAMLAWDQAANYILLDVASQRDLDEDADWMMTLLKSNLFYKVPPMNIRKIIDRFEPVYVEAGDTILRQGEEGDSCYFIKEGTIEVFQSADERSSPEKVAELVAGQCFGEDALINQERRNATIKMKTHGVLMQLIKKDFLLLLKSDQVNGVFYNELESAPDKQWLDVRSQDEYERGHYQGALHMPLDLLKLKSRLLNVEQEYVIYCNSGRRSEAATCFLAAEGYKVSWLRGGMSVTDSKQSSLLSVSSVDDLETDQALPKRIA